MDLSYIILKVVGFDLFILTKKNMDNKLFQECLLSNKALILRQELKFTLKGKYLKVEAYEDKCIFDWKSMYEFERNPQWS